MHAECEEPWEETREMLESVARLAIADVCDEQKVALGCDVKEFVDDGVRRLDI